MNKGNKLKLSMIVIISVLMVLFIGGMKLGAHSGEKQEPPFSTSTENKTLTKKLQLNDADKLLISVEVKAGGIKILEGKSSKLVADFDPQFYEVEIKQSHQEWKINVKGKKTKMASNYVKLSIPNHPNSIKANVIEGSLLYDIPENGKSDLDITAEDSSLSFSSTNKYKYNNISVTALEKEFIEDSHILYPYYFNKIDEKLSYKNDNATSNIDIVLAGFTNVTFK
ncbi:hypothetical protein J2Z32_001410 [Paenibacillus turicensis]|uniref:Adhesin domain-containing protein n=1 Tax=Paenibacillus turicensis TaxID=160487 RepID=A0ABS4FQG6_9BACL|nr:hypothetical protein [Paenibacillus turicensis]MBP1904786.1 hypothetical protein [Paenibacillus turicensis]